MIIQVLAAYRGNWNGFRQHMRSLMESEAKAQPIQRFDQILAAEVEKQADPKSERSTEKAGYIIGIESAKHFLYPGDLYIQIDYVDFFRKMAIERNDVFYLGVAAGLWDIVTGATQLDGFEVVA